jgi:hypothetical protein
MAGIFTLVFSLKLMPIFSKLLLLDYKGSIAWYDNKEQHYWCI